MTFVSGSVWCLILKQLEEVRGGVVLADLVEFLKGDSQVGIKRSIAGFFIGRAAYLLHFTGRRRWRIGGLGLGGRVLMFVFIVLHVAEGGLLGLLVLL